MFRLIRDLVRPYRGTSFVILPAMAVERAMSLAGPWPLKIILDNVAGLQRLPEWFDHSTGAMSMGPGPDLRNDRQRPRPHPYSPEAVCPVL